MKLKAVFLDKDGTLIPDIPYNVNADKILLNDEVIEGLQLLQSHGYLLIVVSNQSGIAHGFFSSEQFDSLKNTLCRMFMKLGIYIDGFYYCPHHPEGKIDQFSKECDCRKPKPGLILQAAEDKNIDLSMSWMIGDILNDVESGNWAGCKSILINNGNETQWVPGENRMPEFFAKDLAEAANYILASHKSSSDEKKLERQKEYFVYKA